MSRVSLILALLFLSFGNVSAQQVEIDFKSLGRNDLLIQGQRGQASVVLKLPEYVNPSTLKIKLNFKRSEVLNLSKSLLSIFQDGEQIKTQRLANEVSFTWELENLKINENQKELHLQILSELAISDEPCKDLGSSGLWLRLLESSSLQGDSLARPETEQFIANCFESKKAIVVPMDLQVQQEPSVAKLAFAIHNLTGKMLPIIYENDLASSGISNYIFIGLEDQVPLRMSRQLSFLANQKAGRIELIQQDNLDSTKAFDKYDVLLISGVNQSALEKAVNLLLDQRMIRSTFSKSAIALESKKPNNAKKVGLNPYITFEDLGAWNYPLGGVGASSLGLTFQRADIVFPCTYIDIRLHGKYTGLKKNDLAYVNLYVNEQLVETKTLGNNGLVELLAKVEMTDLRANNSLRYEFLYIPSEEDCGKATNTFSAQIETDRSGIIFPDNASNKPATFNYFPENFYSENISLIYSPGFGLKSVEAISEMLRLLNNSRGLNDWLIPEIVNTREIRIKNHKGNNRIYLLSTQDSLFFNSEKAVIHRMGDVVQLIEGGEVSFSTLMDPELAYAQVYEQSGEIILAMLADPLTNPDGLMNMMHKLEENLGKESFDLLTSRGNKFIFYNTSSSGVKEAGKALGKFGLLSFWSKYGLLLSIGILALLALLFFWVNKRNQLDSDLF